MPEKRNRTRQRQEEGKLEVRNRWKSGEEREGVVYYTEWGSLSRKRGAFIDLFIHFMKETEEFG
jgi:hypothetical protein